MHIGFTPFLLKKYPVVEKCGHVSSRIHHLGDYDWFSFISPCPSTDGKTIPQKMFVVTKDTTTNLHIGNFITVKGSVKGKYVDLHGDSYIVIFTD